MQEEGAGTGRLVENRLVKKLSKAKGRVRQERLTSKHLTDEVDAS